MYYVIQYNNYNLTKGKKKLLVEINNLGEFVNSIQKTVLFIVDGRSYKTQYIDEILPLSDFKKEDIREDIHLKRKIEELVNNNKMKPTSLHESISRSGQFLSTLNQND